MTINLSSPWPKILGALGLFFTIFAMGYSNSFYQIAGLTAFNFFSMLALACNSAGTFISRQNNVTSENAGAIPETKPPTLEELKAELAAIKVRMGDKPNA